MTKQAQSEVLSVQMRSFVMRGGEVKRLPAGRADGVQSNAFARGVDAFHLRAFLRAARGV